MIAYVRIERMHQFVSQINQARCKYDIYADRRHRHRCSMYRDCKLQWDIQNFREGYCAPRCTQHVSRKSLINYNGTAFTISLMQIMLVIIKIERFIFHRLSKRKKKKLKKRNGAKCVFQAEKKVNDSTL